MSLAAMQQAFLDGLTDPEGGPCPVLPDSSHGGFAIYRNAYHTVMVEAICDNFPRTLAYAGEESFRAAATHHVIASPPSSWSLDHEGCDFDATCEEVFADNAEVAELAALEWAMHEVFVSADIEALGGAGFAAATASFGDSDWSALQLRLVPSRILPCRFDLLGWWKDADTVPVRLPSPAAAIVWREEERPVFIQIDAAQAAMLDNVDNGLTLGGLCASLTDRMPEEKAIPLAATYLQDWIAHGWIAGVALDPAVEGEGP